MEKFKVRFAIKMLIMIISKFYEKRKKPQELSCGFFGMFMSLPVNDEIILVHINVK